MAIYILTKQSIQIQIIIFQHYMSGDDKPHSLGNILSTSQPFFQNQAIKNSKVRVVCRVKPINDNDQPFEMRIDKDQAQISILQVRQQTTKTFTFNRIYTNEKQQQFVKQVCDPVIEKAINGQGYLVFSYGVTNSGKTHTILGSQTEPGILPYLINQLSQYQPIFLSAIQLYNDQFFSLSNKQKLTPREINGFIDFQQCDVSQQIDKRNMDEKIMQYVKNRAQNQTKFNSKSSRSHAIFRIKFGNVVIGVVDLAGSERSNRVFASIDQTSNINKSLLCLGRCIKALNENPESNLPIPYRDSKLTKVLIQYFAAKDHIIMIANINQSQKCFHENMKVLDYAVMAKDIHHCSTINSIKKNQYRFMKTSKVDVFESIYKSSTKSNFAHKSLKSSRSKLNQKLQKSGIKVADSISKFAKALKAQQLKINIQKYDSNQETFDYMIQYFQQKELEDQLKNIQTIKNSHYQSPYAVNIKNGQLLGKQTVEAGVGRSRASIEQMRKQIYYEMKQELKILLEQQRLMNMKSQQTSIGQSLTKQFSSKSPSNADIIPSIQTTPVKSKQEEACEQNFVVKTSSAIYSSVKKIISQKMHSLKKLVPSFKKQQQQQFPIAVKPQKLKLCNYNELYEQLFKKQQPDCDQRDSDFSFNVQPIKSSSKTKNPFLNNDQGIQKMSYSFIRQNQKDSHENSVQTDDQNLIENLSVCQKQTQVCVRNSQIVSNRQDNNIQQVHQASSSEKSTPKQTRVTKSKPKTRLDLRKKRQRNKIKQKQAALRVAQTRKMAARICRAQSRTPLKKRLRSYK